MNMRIDLDKIRVASPCNARWEDMSGDERARFCDSCQKNVYNLSAMTRAQIERLIREKEGKFCGRFYRRPDGRMLTADCPTGRRRRRDRLARWGGAMFGSLLLLLGFHTLGRAQEKGRSTTPKAQPCRLMGEVSVRPAVLGDVAMPIPATNQAPIIMGKIALPQPALTNKLGVLTNCPTPNREPVVMGVIALPAQTNRTAPPVAPK